MSLRTWALSLTLTFGMFATSCRQKEPPTITWHQPAIIEQTISYSAAHSDHGVISPEDGEDFYHRLKNIVTKCDAADLQTLRDSNVTIALDQRLTSSNNVTFFYPTVEAALYKQDTGYVLTLWDDGKREGMSNLYYLEKTPEIVHNLATMIRAGQIPDTTIYCGRFKDANRDQHMEWRTEEKFSKKALKKNPVLRLPPGSVLPVQTPEKKKTAFIHFGGCNKNHHKKHK